jgi:hypothetical protein
METVVLSETLALLSKTKQLHFSEDYLMVYSEICQSLSARNRLPILMRILSKEYFPPPLMKYEAVKTYECLAVQLCTFLIWTPYCLHALAGLAKGKGCWTHLLFSRKGVKKGRLLLPGIEPMSLIPDPSCHTKLTHLHYLKSGIDYYLKLSRPLFAINLYRFTNHVRWIKAEKTNFAQIFRLLHQGNDSVTRWRGTR